MSDMTTKTSAELLSAKLAEHCETLRDALAYIEQFTNAGVEGFNPDHPTLLALNDMRRAQRVFGPVSVIAGGPDALAA